MLAWVKIPLWPEAVTGAWCPWRCRQPAASEGYHFKAIDPCSTVQTGLRSTKTRAAAFVSVSFRKQALRGQVMDALGD